MTWDENGWLIDDAGKRLRNDQLYAESPMYFACDTDGCPRPVVVAESYTPPRARHCDRCRAQRLLP